MVTQGSPGVRDSLLDRNEKVHPLLVVLFIGCLVLLMSYPLFRNEYLPGDDWAYHLARIEGIKDGILFGEFPVKIHAMLLNGFGYGSGFFYPSFFLYIPAFFRLMGIDAVISYKLFALLIIIAIVGSTYYCTNRLLLSKYAAICATLLFCASHMVISNIFWRTAVGEMLASVFLPFVIYGVYNVLKEKFSKPWVICLGFAGLMFSHLISLFFALIYAGIMIVLNSRVLLHREPIPEGGRDKKNIRLLFRLLIAATAVLLVTMSFWLPMFEQLARDSFQSSVPFYHARDYTLEFSELLLFSTASLGIPLSAFTLISLLLRILSLTKKEKRVWSTGDGYLVLGIGLSLLTTKLIPWNLLDSSIGFIQFPWRILTMASFFLALGIVSICTQYFVTQKGKIAFFSILCVFCIFFCVTILFVRWEIFSTSKSLDIYNAEFATGIGQEWMPLNTDVAMLQNSTIIVSNTDAEISADKKGTTLVFAADADSTAYQVPLLYYYGYRATIEKTDGSFEELPITKTSNNTICLLVPERTTGTITVSYAGTPVQRVSYAISLLSLAGIGIGTILWKRSHSQSPILRNRS